MRNAAHLLIASILLAGCSKQPPAAPPSVKPVASRDDALMQAVFNKDIVEHEGQFYKMSHLADMDLPDGRTVLIVNGSPVTEKGEDDAYNATPGMLSAYLLQRTNDGWKVRQHRLNLDQIGSNGQAGAVKWITLGPGKPGFMVSAFYRGQGLSTSSAAIYDVSGEIRSLGGFSTSSDNGDACLPETAQCWAIESRIHVDAEVQASGYNDMLADFTDKRYTVEEGKNELQVKSHVKQRARYHFDGTKYVLISGENPINSVN